MMDTNKMEKKNDGHAIDAENIFPYPVILKKNYK